MVFKESFRIKLGEGECIRYDPDTLELVIGQKVPTPERPKEVDVTAECCTELRKSSTSGGHYVAISHEGKVLFALGVDEKSKVIPFQSNRSGRYRIGHVDRATVSFKITKKV